MGFPMRAFILLASLSVCHGQAGFVSSYVKITNLEIFKTYMAALPSTLEAYDGKVIIKTWLSGGIPRIGYQTPANLERTTGEDFDLTLALQFASTSDALQWYRSAAYQKILPLRLHSSTGPFAILQGTGAVNPAGAGTFSIEFMKVNNMTGLMPYLSSAPEIMASYNGIMYGMGYLPAGQGFLPNAAFTEGTTGSDYTAAMFAAFPNATRARALIHSAAYDKILKYRYASTTGPGCMADVYDGGASSRSSILTQSTDVWSE
jgi:uncharacterized protein (DUF1330 family)